jgi:hypothetical protein
VVDQAVRGDGFNLGEALFATGMGGLTGAAGAWGSWARFKAACFAAGTPIRIPGGSKAIELLVVGDLVLCRDENDPNGPVVLRVVVNVFVSTGWLLWLRVNGQRIGTSSEHPFWVLGLGWTLAGQLQPGQQLCSEDGQVLVVEQVELTDEHVTLYNVEVDEHHTYFVGCLEWGFGVWAHNAFCGLDDEVGKAAAARFVELSKAGEIHPWPILSRELGVSFTPRQTTAVRHYAEDVLDYSKPGTKRGPKTAADGEEALQLRANAAINEVLQNEFPELQINGGGRERGTLVPIRPETALPESGPGVRSPDFSLYGEVTPEVAARLAQRLQAVVQAELGLDSSVGTVRLYGVPTDGPIHFGINIGPVRASGAPTKKELSQILSYRAKEIPIIHVSYGRES